jgi:hypothetical protein
VSDKTNAKEIYEALMAKKAAMTFAVAQFSDNPKLKKFQEDQDTLAVPIVQ